MITTLVCSLAGITFALPQGQGRGELRTRPTTFQTLAPRYPEDLQVQSIAAFVGSGSTTALRTQVAASGSGDLDGDGNVDLWFLAGQGTWSNQPSPEIAGDLSIQFANTASLGRFRNADVVQNGPWWHATTFRTTTSSVDRILAVHPDLDAPLRLHWNRHTSTSDPRIGYMGWTSSGWVTGKGAYEIVSRDDSFNGHDNFAVLQAMPNGITQVKKMVLQPHPFGFLELKEEVSLQIPAFLCNLRLLDLDNDLRSDFVAYAPGIGIVACRDDGQGKFVLARFWPQSGILNDLAVGDLDLNGRDDVLACFDKGAVVAFSQAPSVPTGQGDGFTYLGYENPTGVGILATSKIVDLNGKGSMHVMGFPRDGQNYVLHPYNQAALGLVGPWIEQAPAGMQGAGLPYGTPASHVLIADVDNDSDPDVVLQSPAGDQWYTLRNPKVSMAPIAMTEVDLGPAPVGESSRHQRITVQLPDDLVQDGVQEVEFAFFVADPDTEGAGNLKYMYWGRLTPSIDTGSNTTTVSIYYRQNESLWRQERLSFKNLVSIGSNTDYIVYPLDEDDDNIRGGPMTFFSVHGVKGKERKEGKDSESEDEDEKDKSSLGAKWTMRANPPKADADRDLLPWD